MKSIASKLGAVFYIIWGALHVLAAYKVYALATSVEAGIVQGRLFQDAWNLLFFAVFAIVVAVLYNWKNDRFGYWLNLIVVSVADVGFIVTILMPGYLPLIPGIVGPVVWVLAVVFSTIGLMQHSLNNNSARLW